MQICVIKRFIGEGNFKIFLRLHVSSSKWEKKAWEDANWLSAYPFPSEEEEGIEARLVEKEGALFVQLREPGDLNSENWDKEPVPPGEKTVLIG